MNELGISSEDGKTLQEHIKETRENVSRLTLTDFCYVISDNITKRISSQLWPFFERFTK